jgi:hypothetical protein
MEIAVATPAILPTPTRPPNDMANAWNDDTPAKDFLPTNIRRIISPNPRTCRNRVRIEK